MAEQGKEPVFRILWDGVNLDSRGCITWSVANDYLTGICSWSAELAVPPSSQVKPGDILWCPVTLQLDGATLCHGICEWVDNGESPMLWRVGGRDYLANIFECDTDPALIVTEGDTLQSAILKALGPVGITSMLADGGFALRTLRCGQPIGRKKTKIAPGEVKLQDLKPAPGRKLSDWVGHLAMRHGLTLQPGTSRTQIQLHAPDYEQPPIGTLRRSSQYGLQSNIVRGNVRRDASHVPTVVTMTSQANAVAEFREAGLTKSNVITVAQSWAPEATGIQAHGVGVRRKPGASEALPAGAVYRMLFHQDKEARNADQLLRDATRQVADRLRHTLQYSCDVRGFRDPAGTAFFAPDTMLKVEDDVAQVDETLWVAARILENGKNGPTTKMQLWRPGSFQIS